MEESGWPEEDTNSMHKQQDPSNNEDGWGTSIPNDNEGVYAESKNYLEEDAKDYILRRFGIQIKSMYEGERLLHALRKKKESEVSVHEGTKGFRGRGRSKGGDDFNREDKWDNKPRNDNKDGWNNENDGWGDNKGIESKDGWGDEPNNDWNTDKGGWGDNKGAESKDGWGDNNATKFQGEWNDSKKDESESGWGGKGKSGWENESKSEWGDKSKW